MPESGDRAAESVAESTMSAANNEQQTDNHPQNTGDSVYQLHSEQCNAEPIQDAQGNSENESRSPMDRDLEKGEPERVPPVGLTATDEESPLDPQLEPASTTHARSSLFSQNLESILGSRRCWRYSMGLSAQKDRGFLEKAMLAWISSLVIAPSLDDDPTHTHLHSEVRPLFNFSAGLLSRLFSQWMHAGNRQHSKASTLSKTLPVEMHMFQNIGDPFSRWVNARLHQELGLNALFFAEHLALVYDGDYAGLEVSSTNRCALTGRCHVQGVLSELPWIRFRRPQSRPFRPAREDKVVTLGRQKDYVSLAGVE